MFRILLAASPILVILVGILGMKKSAVKVAPITLLFTIIIGFIVFGNSGSSTILSIKVGVLDGLRIIWLIWAAFTMLTMMQSTGVMNKIKELIAGLTTDRRIHVLIIAVMFGVFLEGAAGAGTPAAIAAPFLVGLGFSPLSAATAALISNSIPVSWGGAGVTTIMGTEPVREFMTVMEASSMAGRIHMIGAIILPFLVIFAIFGKKGFKNLLPFILFSGVTMSFFLYCFSNIVDPSITSLATGLMTIIVSIIYLKIINVKTPEEFLYNPNKDLSQKEPEQKMGMKNFIAASPYIILVILLPVIRFSFSINVLAKYGYTLWVGAVIFVSAFIGSLFIKVSISDFLKHCFIAFKKVLPAAIAMCSLLVVSDIMTQVGMMSLLAKTLASISGQIYPAIAVLIGTLGSFMTGTALGSNIMFGTMHVEAATSLGMNPITVVAGQNAGASLGNMICPNNIIAVATTVGILGQEGSLMKKVLLSFFVFLILYGVLAYIYTLFLFPMFGI